MYSVECLYIPLKPSSPRVGLAERFLKRRLERQGWIVWRGGMIHLSREEELYSNMKKKYDHLQQLLKIQVPEHIEQLQYFCRILPRVGWGSACPKTVNDHIHTLHTQRRNGKKT